MGSKTHEKMKIAKKYKDIVAMEKLYKENPNDNIIKFEYARLLKFKGNKNKSKMLLLELLNTDNWNYATMELGKIEKEQGDIKKAREYFESLLNTQSKAYAILELGILEKEQGNIEKAREYFETLLNTQDKSYAFIMLVLLEFLEKNYLSVFNYINEALKQNIDVNYNFIIYLSKELNVFFDVDYEKMNYNYSMNQLLDYDEYCAIEHIVDRHVKNDFNKKVDVYKLFNVVKDYLSEENKINKLNFNDLYLLRLDNIGANGENYLLVITLPHSKNIITMYPVEDKMSINKYINEYENNGKKKLIKK